MDVNDVVLTLMTIQEVKVQLKSLGFISASELHKNHLSYDVIKHLIMIQSILDESS